MDVRKELKISINTIAFKNKKKIKREITDQEKSRMSDEIFENFKKRNYDFSNYNKLVLTQKKKKRFTVRYEEIFSTENVLLYTISRILKKTFKVRFQNRNIIMKNFFNTFLRLQNSSNPITIVKFDFKDFFNSVSSIFLFEKYIGDKIIDRDNYYLIEDFLSQTKYTYAGLRTSNYLIEVVSQNFDRILISNLKEYGLIYYDRYVDDGIFILNQNVEKDVCVNILESSLNEVFRDSSKVTSKKCKTKFNYKKFVYTSSENDTSTDFSFLGYRFLTEFQGGKFSFKCGISDAKIIKYQNKINNIIESHIEEHTDSELELLRHKVKMFVTRQVYITNKFNEPVWNSRGFINNYNELRNIISKNQSQINVETINFLERCVINGFNFNKLDLPYYLRCNGFESYSLKYNLMNNKTIIFDEKIGYSYDALVKLCESVKINKFDKDGVIREYNQLVREYLILTKVGI